MDWLKSENKQTIGLKYPESDTYIEFSIYPEEKKGLLNLMIPKNVDELLNLLDPLLIRFIKEFSITNLYQVIGKVDLDILLNKNWKTLKEKLTIEEIENDFYLVGCDIQLFKECMYRAFNLN